MKKREARQTPYIDQSRIRSAASPMETLQALSLPPNQRTTENRTLIPRSDQFFQSLSESPEQRTIQAANSNQNRTILAPIPQRSLQALGFPLQQSTNQDRITLNTRSRGAFQTFAVASEQRRNSREVRPNDSLLLPILSSGESITSNVATGISRTIAPRVGRYFQGINLPRQQSTSQARTRLQPRNEISLQALSLPPEVIRTNRFEAPLVGSFQILNLPPEQNSRQDTAINQSRTAIDSSSERSLQALSLPPEQRTNSGETTNRRASANQGAKLSPRCRNSNQKRPK